MVFYDGYSAALRDGEWDRLASAEFWSKVSKVLGREFKHDALVVCEYRASAGYAVPLYGEDTPVGSDGPAECILDEIIRRKISPEPALENREQLPERSPWSSFGETNRLACSILYSPIRLHKHLVGYISVQSYTPGYYNQDDLERLSEFARDFAEPFARFLQRDQLLKLSQAVEQSATMVLITNTRGQIEYANRKLLEVSGYTLDEIWGKNPRIFKTIQTHPDTFDELWDQLDAGKNWFGEFCNRKKNGEHYWVAASISPILDRDGKPSHFVAVEEDMTDRKKTAEALHNRERILAAVSYAAEHFLRLSDWDDDLHVFLEKLGEATLANRVIIVENKRDEDGDLIATIRDEYIRGMNVSPTDRLNPCGVSLVGEGFASWVDRFSKGEAVHGVVSNFEGHGANWLRENHVVSIVAMPIFVGIRWWGCLVLHDCYTERRFSTAELEALKTAAAVIGAAFERLESNYALRESEKTNRELLNTSPALSFLLSPEGRVLAANDHLAEAFGTPLPQILGEDIRKFLPPEIGLERHRELQAAIRSKAPRHFVDQMDSRIFEHHVCPIVSPSGEVTRVAIYAQDVTDLRRNERLAALGMTASSLAHYIKNVQTSLSGSISVLESALERADQETIQQVWPIVRRSTKRINQLVKNMLALGREKEAFFEDEDLNRIIQEAVEESMHLAQVSDIEIEMELCKDLPPVPMNSSRLFDAALNLIGNAIEATEGGRGRKPFVKIRTHMAPDGHVAFSVMDNGMGIPDELHDQLFEPFFTTKEKKGTGLGLAVVKRIVEEHRGKIDFETEPGEGTTFHIHLPTGT